MRLLFEICTAVALSAVLAGCSSGTKQLSRTDIQLSAGELRTFGFAAQMLAEQCSSGNATHIFCQQQSEFLSDKVEDALRELHGNTSDAEYERKQLEDIGVELRDIVLRVEQDLIRPADAAEAGRLGAISKTLEDGLRK